jgi:sugar O-acyltransferase (sialic acid O-acetyltransferase NeuD family)
LYVIFGSGGLAKELIGYGVKPLYLVSTEPLNNKNYKFDVRLKVGILPRDVRFLLAVADPEIKRRIVAENEDRWDSFIHPTAVVSPYAKIGKGCLIGPQAILAGDPILGDFVFLNTNATVGHDTTIGSYTTLFPNSEVCGDCEIGEDCLFGIGSYVLPGKKLASGVKVSAGSVVRHNVETACTVQGNPAKPRC